MLSSLAYEVAAYVSIAFGVGAIMILFLTLFKLRGLHIQIFQKCMIYLYLLIYLIQIS